MELKDLAGHTYEIGKLPLFKQMHVARKLAPLLGTVATIKQMGGAGLGGAFEQFAGPIAQTLAKMSDEEVEQIIGDCLACVRRKIKEIGWMPMWNAQAKSLQYDDIDLPTMLQLVYAVLEGSIGHFLPVSLGASPEQPPAQM